MEPVRSQLVELLRDCGVYGLDDQGLDQAFIRGECDVRLESLDMDSLASMEVCVALEKSFGLTITPSELPSLQSLQQVLDALPTESDPTSPH